MKTLPPNIKVMEVKEPTGLCHQAFGSHMMLIALLDRLVNEAVHLTTLLQSNGEKAPTRA